MLSQATASVTSGLSSVIETVETSLGVPDPEEVARKVKAEEKLVKEKQAEVKSQETPMESKSESEGEGECTHRGNSNGCGTKAFLALKFEIPLTNSVTVPGDGCSQGCHGYLFSCARCCSAPPILKAPAPKLIYW